MMILPLILLAIVRNILSFRVATPLKTFVVDIVSGCWRRRRLLQNKDIVTKTIALLVSKEDSPAKHPQFTTTVSAKPK